MVYHWENCPSDIKSFIHILNNEIKKVIQGNYAGCYIHGSLALGGFNPKRSDIDILIVTMTSLKLYEKQELAQLLLEYSNTPFPIEVSFLTIDQLKQWQHPCPFDFHYSEFWRQPYEEELTKGTSKYLNEDIQTDPDLAAHITIMNDKGICLEGDPIKLIFPEVPRYDYVSSIMGDYEECLEQIETDPVYCTLNMLRVFCFLKEGIILSKQDAGNWGIEVLPTGLGGTMQKVLDIYTGKCDSYPFRKNELLSLRDFVGEKVNWLLQSSIERKQTK